MTAKGRYWERGEWVETDPLSWSMTYDFPDGIGPRSASSCTTRSLNPSSRTSRASVAPVSG
ncbi:MAG: hypothetical protein ACLSHC_06445 [Bilophila wadsworthia]